MAAGPPYATDRRTLERTCEAEFFTGPGPGGQHRNRSRTGVRLRHRPSGLMVTATERRSRQRNLEAAYERMTRRLQAANRVPEKRRPTRPTKASRRRRLENKRRRSRIKKQRQSPSDPD
jgi:protein subunit release factor B